MTEESKFYLISIKRSILYSRLSILTLLIFLNQSCKKEIVPIVTTSSVTNITGTTASCGGIVISEGSGKVTSKGVCWSTGNIPTIKDNKTQDGSGPGPFSSEMSGLIEGTTYNVRAYATSSLSTGYGDILFFTTLNNRIIFNSSLSYGTINDIDSNFYKTITIGTQVWMAENLKTTKFNNGTEIPLVTDGTAWSNLTTSGYCWYNNDSLTNRKIYGALYNWYAVNTGNLCPVGWHVYSDTEWETMVTFLGGIADFFQGKLEEIGTTHWYSNTPGQIHDATNSSGFTALPGGLRSCTGNFLLMSQEGCWWTNKESDTSTAYGCELYFFYMGGYPSFMNKCLALSVRCIKDN